MTKARIDHDMRDALTQSGLEPKALTLEITETILMHNADETARRLVAIKQLGTGRRFLYGLRDDSV